MRRLMLCSLLLVAACWGQGEDPPGEPVGVFEASGLMVEQSCGAAVPAPDPLDLRFDLRSEAGGRAYWRRVGGALYAGVKNGDTYTFTVSQSWMVIEPDRFRGYTGCSVTQRDVFEFTLETIDEEIENQLEADAGVAASLFTLTGSQSTDIEPLSGADCTPAVASSGGPFLSLPCRVEYVLTGTGESLE